MDRTKGGYMNILKVFEGILKAATALVAAVISIVKAIGSMNRAKA